MSQIDFLSLPDFAVWFDRALGETFPLNQNPRIRALIALDNAMRYSLCAPGKRLRPYLVGASAALFGVDRIRSLRAALAIEMVHCYSLIHDDLPAMDNSPLRRGRRTLHLETNEASAILAGDALLTDAFFLLSDPNTHHNPSVRIALVQSLSSAAGSRGMVGGQMIDFAGQSDIKSIDDVKLLHALKTGAIIRAACELGCILAEASDSSQAALCDYGDNIGLAFQIIDDVLDVAPAKSSDNSSDIGKPVAQDVNKVTFVDFLGVEGAQKAASELVEAACDRLCEFGTSAEALQNLARRLVLRRT